jgi:predicted nucleic acid-binding protein
MPPTHLLDTSVYSQPIRLRPLPSVMQRWKSLGDYRVAVSVVTISEVLYGLERSNSDRLRSAYHEILEGRLLAIPVNERVAAAFGLMKADQERLGRRVPDLDLLIAATARVHGLVVATLDLRHFPLIEGVVVEDWSNPPRLFRVLVSEHDEGIAEILTGLIHMGARAGTTVLTVVPETVLEEDFLNLAIRTDWDLAIVVLHKLSYRSGNIAKVFEDSVQFVSAFTRRFGKRLIAFLGHASLPDYEELILEAGAAAVFRLPTDFQKVAPTIRQYLRQ